MIESDLEVPKKLTIASNYINSKNDADIGATIIKASAKAKKQWFDIRREAKDTKIIGLTIVGNRYHSLAIRNAYSEVSHCRFVGGSDQLSFEGGGGLVAHCRFEGARDDAIDADSSVSWTVEYCTIKGTRDDGIEVRLHGKEGPVTTHIARGNTFVDCTAGIQLIDYEGDSRRRFEIHENIFKNIRNTALDCTIHTADRNVNGSPMVEQVTFFNNTVDGCRNGVTMAPNLVILNSIFTNTKIKGIIKGKYLEAGGTSIVDHCLFFMNGSDYDEGLSMGKGIFRFDPQYRDTTSYELSPGARAVDKGVATYRWKGVEVLRIPDEKYSGKTPDLGAKEYGRVDRLELIRYVNLWRASPVRSPDTAGLTYHPPSGRLIIVDSEVNEYGETTDANGQRIFSGHNVFEVSLDLRRRFDAHFAGPVGGMVTEPTGIAYNPKDGHVYVTDDDRRKIFRYRFDGKRKFGPPVAETKTSLDGRYTDPEGIACDPATGILYVVSGTKQERVLTFRYDTDAGKFVSLGEFSVASHIRDPEGIGIDPETGNVFLVSGRGIAEFRKDGAFVQFFDYTFFNRTNVARTLPGGLTFAPSSNPNDHPGNYSIYISHRGIDNGAFPRKNSLDGAISELRLVRRRARGNTVHVPTDAPTTCKPCGTCRIASRHDPHPRIRSFCEYYGFAILSARPCQSPIGAAP